MGFSRLLNSKVANFVGNFERMKILLSPAKKLDFTKVDDLSKGLAPIFPKETEKLIQNLKKKKAKDIGDLMKLSPQLSQLNYERFQNFGSPDNDKTLAMFGFNGEVYTGLDAVSFTSEDLIEAESKIRILSGLYGVLKPNTIIEPYRLEMGTSLKIGDSKSLYEFWGEKIFESLVAEEKDLIVNLASNEYNKAAKLKNFKGTVVTPNFKEFKEGKYKTIMVYAKKARGLMARWIVQNRVEKAEEIKNFTLDGYVYNNELSKGNDWIFTR